MARLAEQNNALHVNEHDSRAFRSVLRYSSIMSTSVRGRPIHPPGELASMLARLTRACFRRVKTRHNIWTVPPLIKITNREPVKKRTHGSQSLPEGRRAKLGPPNGQVVERGVRKGAMACMLGICRRWLSWIMGGQKTAAGKALRI